MKNLWKIKDDGMHIYEDGTRVAFIETDQFVHVLADMAQHLQWQQVEKNKIEFMSSRRKQNDSDHTNA